MVLVSFYVSTAKEQSKFSSLVTKYKLPSFINLFLNLLFYVVSVQCRVAPKIYRMDKLKAIECAALSCWCCFLKTSVLLESPINRSSAKNSNWSDFCYSKKISLHPFSFRKTVQSLSNTFPDRLRTWRCEELQRLLQTRRKVPEGLDQEGGNGLKLLPRGGRRWINDQGNTYDFASKYFRQS